MCNISNISQSKHLKIKVKPLEKSHKKFCLIVFPEEENITTTYQ